MLMQHTLNDLVLRGCEEDEKKAISADMRELEMQTLALQEERDRLREQLAGELSRLLVGLKSATANATATAAVATDGRIELSNSGGNAHTVLGALFSAK